MWTLYGLAEIGNVVRRWHSRWTSDEGEADEAANAGLLERRMSALSVDSGIFARVEPALFGNLETLCGACEHSDRCRHDLRQDPAGVGWEDYCLNAVVLNAVAELRWFRTANMRGSRR